MDHEREIPIWFFVGALLTAYGVLILGAGLYHLVSPPKETLALAYLHADIWWPLLLLAIGLFYTIRHWPFGSPAKSKAIASQSADLGSSLKDAG